MKWIKFFIVIVLLGSLAVLGWRYWQSEQETLPDDLIRSNGRIEMQRYDVATLYPGRVLDVQVGEGDWVEGGDVVAVLHSAELQARIQAAKATIQRARAAEKSAQAQKDAAKEQLEVAKLDEENGKQLFAKHLISESEWQKRQAGLSAAKSQFYAAEAAIEQARAAVEEAQAQLQGVEAVEEELRLRAPVSGRVTHRLFEVGAVVAAGSRIVSLQDPAEVYMNVFLPLAQVAELQVGDKARIVVDGLVGVYPAKIVYIADKAQFTPKFVETDNQREKLTYRVKLLIPQSVAKRHTAYFKAGMTADAYLSLKRQPIWPDQLKVRLPEELDEDEQ